MGYEKSSCLMKITKKGHYWKYMVDKAKNITYNWNKLELVNIYNLWFARM